VAGATRWSPSWAWPPPRCWPAPRSIDALAVAVGAWLADRDQGPGPAGAGRRRAVAVDGKTLRGARASGAQGRQVHLLAAMDHATRTVLAQRQVNGAPGEVPGFQPLLRDLELIGAVVTADALHTHGDAAEFLVTRKYADYLFTVKANQPTLWTVASACPGSMFPSWTAPATARTAELSCAPSRPSRSAGSDSRTPPRSSRSPAGSAACAVGDGRR